LDPWSMPSAQNKIQIVDTHEASETLAVTRLQRVGYQINRTLLKPGVNRKPGSSKTLINHRVTIENGKRVISCN
jgi:hypothetical protein